MQRTPGRLGVVSFGTAPAARTQITWSTSRRVGVEFYHIREDLQTTCGRGESRSTWSLKKVWEVVTVTVTVALNDVDHSAIWDPHCALSLTFMPGGAMGLAKAESFLPRGARPAVNPHQNYQQQSSGGRVPQTHQLDHTVWADSFHHQQSRSPSSFPPEPPSRTTTRFVQGGGDGSLIPDPIPLTRTRSAQNITSPPPQSRAHYFYEDYADVPSSLYRHSPSQPSPQYGVRAFNGQQNTNANGPPPPPPRHPLHASTTYQPDSNPQNPDSPSPPALPPRPAILEEPESYIPSNTSTETIKDRRTPTNLHPTHSLTPPQASPGASNARPSIGSGTVSAPAPLPIDGYKTHNNHAQAEAAGDAPNSTPGPPLGSPPDKVPRRKPSHRSTLSQERGEFSLPFNQSETSLDQVGELIDQVSERDLQRFANGSVTLKYYLISSDWRANSRMGRELRRVPSTAVISQED